MRAMCNIRLTFFVASAATASSASTAPRPLSFDPFPPDAGTETTLPDDSRETPRRPHPPRSRACLFPDGPCARSGSMPRPRRACSSSLSLSPSSSEKAGCPRAAAPRRFFAAGCMGRNLDTGTIGRIGWRRGLVGGLNSSRGLSDSCDKISLRIDDFFSEHVHFFFFFFSLPLCFCCLPHWCTCVSARSNTRLQVCPFI